MASPLSQLSEEVSSKCITQAEKDRHHMASLTHGILKTRQMNKQNKSRLLETETTKTLARREGFGVGVRNVKGKIVKRVVVCLLGDK